MRRVDDLACARWSNERVSRYERRSPRDAGRKTMNSPRKMELSIAMDELGMTSGSVDVSARERVGVGAARRGGGGGASADRDPR